MLVNTYFSFQIIDENELNLRAAQNPHMPRCPNCSMYFIGERSLNTHLTHYCHKLNASPSVANVRRLVSPDCNIASMPLPKMSPPTKRIGIQIRKVYKTESGAVVCQVADKPRRLSQDSISDDGQYEEINTTMNSSINSTVCNSVISSKERSPLKLKVVKAADLQDDAVKHEYPESKGPFSSREMDDKVRDICNLSKIMCRLCRKKFHSLTGVRRHAAIHMNWSRFVCSVCGYRTYHRFEITKHVLKHESDDCEISDLFEDIHYLNGPFKADIHTASSPSQGSPSKKKTKSEQNNESTVDVLLEVNHNIDTTDNPAVINGQNCESHTKLIEDQNKTTKSLAEEPIQEAMKIASSPQTFTLKLKTVNINSSGNVQGAFGKKLQKSISNSKPKSLDSIIKTITVSAKPCEKSDSNEKYAATLDVKDNSPASKEKTNSSESVPSRQRRVIRAPVKRQYPDSPPTFTGNLSKKQAIALNDKPQQQSSGKEKKASITSTAKDSSDDNSPMRKNVRNLVNATSPIKVKEITGRKSDAKKTSDTKHDVSKTSPGKKWKINISSLTKKHDASQGKAKNSSSSNKSKPSNSEMNKGDPR